MKKLLGVLISLLWTSTQTAYAESVTIAVAANVAPAFEEIEQSFEKETGIEVRPVIGSSGKLTAQIKSGAPFDIFLSADMEYPRFLHKEGLTATEPRVYAYGALVLWTIKNYDLAERGIDVLTERAVEKIAIANPKLAPYGKAAIEVLEFFNIYAEVKPKLVYGENISQTSNYIASASADVGLTAKSVVLSGEMRGKGSWVDVMQESYRPIAQGIVVLKYGHDTNAAASRRLDDYLFSPQARTIFEKYGYTLP